MSTTIMPPGFATNLGGIPNKISDLLSFFIKRHLFNFVGSGGGVMEMLKEIMANNSADNIFNQFKQERSCHERAD